MLKRDPSARFTIPGFVRRQFCSGKMRSAQKLWPQQYQDLLIRQETDPEVVCHNRANLRTWWMFRDEFYWENEDLSSDEVKALILERDAKKKRRVDRALAMMNSGANLPTRKREPVPTNVQAFVWNRDGGRCVKCGSQERLEYDHIIPFSRGGSNSARNLQLLCEMCNRAKGASIG